MVTPYVFVLSSDNNAEVVMNEVEMIRTVERALVPGWANEKLLELLASEGVRSATVKCVVRFKSGKTVEFNYIGQMTVAGEKVTTEPVGEE